MCHITLKICNEHNKVVESVLKLCKSGKLGVVCITKGTEKNHIVHKLVNISNYIGYKHERYIAPLHNLVETVHVYVSCTGEHEDMNIDSPFYTNSSTTTTTNSSVDSDSDSNDSVSTIDTSITPTYAHSTTSISSSKYSRPRDNNRRSNNEVY